MSITNPTDTEVAIITIALRMFPDSPLDGSMNDFDYSDDKKLAMKLHKSYLALHKKREKERLAREFSGGIEFEEGVIDLIKASVIKDKPKKRDD
tara:strand:+ start:5782 stop:6063 length:282 start_codon:yes stop_codon:yes gene_type:complete